MFSKSIFFLLSAVTRLCLTPSFSCFMDKKMQLTYIRQCPTSSFQCRGWTHQCYKAILEEKIKKKNRLFQNFVPMKIRSWIIWDHTCPKLYFCSSKCTYPLMGFEYLDFQDSFYTKTCTTKFSIQTHEQAIAF